MGADVGYDTSQRRSVKELQFVDAQSGKDIRKTPRSVASAKQGMYLVTVIKQPPYQVGPHKAGSPGH